MTDRKQALMDLLDKVEWGECPHWQDAGKAIGINPDDRHLRVMGAYHGSLDAAKALHETVLPASASAVVDMEGDCDLYGGTGDGEWECSRSSSCQNNPARAWLIAILKALIAEEDE